jgi:hypothetical protein
MAAVGADGGLVPMAFVAVTVKVYDVPLVSPVTVMGLLFPVALLSPGCAVTSYLRIGLPPSLAGGVNDTVATPSPGSTVPIVGGSGGSAVG